MAFPRLPARLLAALPDAVTAGVFLALWIAPLRFGDGGVRTAMLVMLVEFVLIHAAMFLGTRVLSARTPARRIALLLVFAGFYGMFIAAWSVVFRAWWPLLAFAWLLLGKAAIAADPGRSETERLRRMQSDQLLATLAYLAGAFATTLVPLPRLGIGADVVPRLGLPGGGLWVEQPHTVIAFGALYFGLLAWSKWRDWQLPLPAPRQGGA